MTARLRITSSGAVSPAGWGVPALWAAREAGSSFALRHGFHSVPAPLSTAEFLRHPRLRRASAISRYVAAAALEALGPERIARAQAGQLRLGIVCAMVNGCVAYSGKFYGEVLQNPATASPILFPETVFNAPTSHLATLLGVTGPVATLVGDPAQFITALDMASLWLEMGLADACLVIGAEEADWVTGEAARWLHRGLPLAEGAGAVLLERTDRGVPITTLVQRTLTTPSARIPLAHELRQALAAPGNNALLVDDRTGHRRTDAPTQAAWSTYAGPHWSPLSWLGHGLGAATAWQTVLAVEALVQQRAQTAVVVAQGGNHQAGGVALGPEGGLESGY